MASVPKKPTSNTSTPTGAAGRRGGPASSPTPARGTSPGSVLSSNGVARTSSIKATPSTRPARPGVRRPGSVANSTTANQAINGGEDAGKEEDARAEAAAMVDGLKKSLREAELGSEDYQHQLATSQQKIEDLMQDHSKMEERLHESTEKIEELETQVRESSRHVREMETIYESERVAMMKDREEATNRESDLKATIQKIKETMAGKEARHQIENERPSLRKGRSSSRGSPTEENMQFAPSNSVQRSDSKGTSRLVMQKDQIIEGLRLELAEAQIKLVEMENAGGGRLQELERSLLEARMTNARLMEDNESFQLLLGERTLHGDFSKSDVMQAPVTQNSGLGSLAEELESAEGESDNFRRVEAEARSLRDQNKALTLYIEKIIGRVLEHGGFETILTEESENLSQIQKTGVDKDLPPPPPADKDKDKEEDQPTTFLGRAMSVARRQRPASQMFSAAPASQQDELTTSKRPRPQSQIIAPAPAQEHVPTANENPMTAPSIPLGRATSVSNRGRTHRRTQSEKSNETVPGAAAVINQMYRGPSRESGGGLSPMSPGGSTPRSQYFSSGVLTGNSSTSGHPSASSRPPSGLKPGSSGQQEPISGSASTISHDSKEVPSPPRNSAGNTTYTGAVMTQNKLRPLRLVQGDDQAAQKKANRGSWIGWFNRGKEDEGSPGAPLPGAPNAPGS